MLHLARELEVVEPRVVQGIRGADPQLGSQLEHALEEIDTGGVDLRQDDPQVLRGIHGEVLLVFRVLRDAWPRAFGWRAHNAEDPHELILVRGAREEGTARVHLGHDASGRPDIDAGVIGPRSEKDIRGSVPERNHLVGEGIDGDSKSTS